MTMRKLLPALALTGLLGFTACTDAYGRYDPVATGFLAAGAAVAAVAVGVAASQPSRPAYYGRPSYGRPYYGRPVYYSGYHPPRRAYW
ncbi:hypothetical protein [Sediminicoccus rosea]|jgi:hypothetical protein|uniref:Lipoprotein n=1 Tax=Sediminicoccus rosea TaxID=1225128 RepID=A0ABZ0PM84_9PROT|nr:hypothetical protein [Sediminicoccus rosea]WPB86572.1 hypothetical protein R9Z33_06760 [Sediminicoccus rosea]